MATARPVPTIPADAADLSTRDRILDAARQVLGTLPISKVTMEDIARAAGMSRRTIYKHFRNRNELVNTLLAEHMITQQHPVLRKLNQRKPSAKSLTAMIIAEQEIGVEHVLRTFPAQPALDEHIAESVLSSPEIMDARRAIWTPILQRYRDAGLLRPELDLERTIRWITYLGTWFTLHPTALAADHEDLGDYIRDYVVTALLQPTT